MTNEEAADVIAHTLKKYDKPKTKNKDLAEFQEALRLAITALSHPPAPPEGWVMVPREPTDKMLKAAFVAMNQTPAAEWKAMKAANLSPRAISDAKMAPRYRAMISAAPPAPETPE